MGGILRYGKREMLPVRQPRYGHVFGAFLRGGEPPQPGAIDVLLEDREVAFAIRLKRHALTVCRPDGKAVAAAERQPPRRARSAQLVYPDDRFLPIVAVEHEPCAV